MEHQNLVLNRPLIRGESFTLSALADTYMAGYKALDPYFGSRLQFFVEILGSKNACDIDADDVQDCLDILTNRTNLRRYYKAGFLLSATGDLGLKVKIGVCPLHSNRNSTPH